MTAEAQVPLVKICGLRTEADAREAVAAGADLVGFVFVPGTRRAVSPAEAVWIRDLAGALTVGVFKDAPLAEILRVREQLGLDRVQLHGSEPDGYLDALGERVLRRVPTAGGVDWPRVAALASRCLPLLDPGAGDGVAADWGAWTPPRGVPFGLAGGLGPGNVAAAVRAVRPSLVDVSSGVEVRPGVKDREKMRAFVAAVRKALG